MSSVILAKFNRPVIGLHFSFHRQLSYLSAKSIAAQFFFTARFYGGRRSNFPIVATFHILYIMIGFDKYGGAKKKKTGSITHFYVLSHLKRDERDDFTGLSTWTGRDWSVGHNPHETDADKKVSRRSNVRVYPRISEGHY